MAKKIFWEDNESIALVEWSLLIPDLRDRLIHYPNGGKRNPREASRLKRMGVKAGVSDYFLPLARGPYHGLWIELKATPPNNARLQLNQREFLLEKREDGYCAFCCKGLLNARALMIRYLLLTNSYLISSVAHGIFYENLSIGKE